MIRTGLAVVATTLWLAGGALAGPSKPAPEASPSPAATPAPAASPAPATPPPVDFSKVEIKTTDLGDGVYMLEGQGGNITVATAKDGIIMVDGEFAPLHDKIKAAIATVSNQPVKYLINTHFHGDHTGGNAPFAKDGATVVSEVNVKTRLAAGTTNGLTGAKTPPVAPEALPAKTYTGQFKIRLPGRVADLKHIANAHTDGDTYVWFKTANVLATGDTFTNGRYPNIDFANGGNIAGMIAAANAYLKLANDKTPHRAGPWPDRRQGRADRISQHARHRARPHGEAREGRQERGRRGGGKAVCRSRCQMGADRARLEEFHPRGLAFAGRQAGEEVAAQADSVTE